MRRSQSNILILILILSIPLINTKAQAVREDIDLIKMTTMESSIDHHHHTHPDFLLSNHPSAFVRYNPLTLVLGSLMWTYQKVVSPQFSATCLYSPSCSAYSIDLISDYGVFIGIILTADRLSRCNRMALMDFKSWEIDSKNNKIIESTSYYRINE